MIFAPLLILTGIAGFVVPYLGPAALNFRGRPRRVLFFAVSHR